MANGPGNLIEPDPAQSPNAARTAPISARRTARFALTFSGRATRTEVASYALGALLVSVAVSLVSGLLLDFETRMLLTNALALALAAPVPALLVRRLHDQGRSARWVWLAVFGFTVWAGRTLVSLALGYETRITLDKVIWPLDWLVILANIAMILLIILPGTQGPNRFGPDPRGRE